LQISDNIRSRVKKEYAILEIELMAVAHVCNFVISSVAMVSTGESRARRVAGKESRGQGEPRARRVEGKVCFRFFIPFFFLTRQLVSSILEWVVFVIYDLA